MELFFGELRVVSTETYENGNTYHITLNRSLVISIQCEIGFSEKSNNDNLYLNLIKVIRNSDFSEIGEKKFNVERYTLQLLKTTSVQLLQHYFKNKYTADNSNLSIQEITELSEQMIENVFKTNQRRIDDKINLLF